MVSSEFPTEQYCSSIVRFLKAVDYNDTNLTSAERIDALHFVYVKTVEWFNQPLQVQTLKTVDRRRIEQVARTIPPLVVYCWSRVSKEVQADISIFLAIMNVLDDHEISHVSNDSRSHLASFWTDLLQGKDQKHPLWLLTNTHAPQLLAHYGPFCSWNIMRATFDFFEGCWIEQHNFQGYKGADCFPTFMRRMNGLGGAVAGTLFPAENFDEQRQFKDLSCVMAHMDGPVTLINDLFSYYKEFDQDEANLVSNWCTTDGIDKMQALERLTEATEHACQRILDIFADKDPQILDTIRCFIHGYITFHICSKRYRLSELHKTAAGPHAEEFRIYYEKSLAMGMVDQDAWAYVPEGMSSRESTMVTRAMSLSGGFVPSFLHRIVQRPVLALGFLEW